MSRGDSVAFIPGDNAYYQNGNHKMNELVLFDTNVKVNEDDMVSLTDIWKSAKAASERKTLSLHKRGINSLTPSKFLNLVSTKLFVSELSKRKENFLLKITKGKHGETFAHRMLAYKYAAFIDPAFEVGVYTVLDQYFTGKFEVQASLTTRLEVLTSTLSIGQKHISHPAREMRYWRDIKRGLLEEIAFVTNELQMQLPFNNQ